VFVLSTLTGQESRSGQSPLGMLNITCNLFLVLDASLEYQMVSIGTPWIHQLMLLWRGGEEALRHFEHPALKKNWEPLGVFPKDSIAEIGRISQTKFPLEYAFGKSPRSTKSKFPMVFLQFPKEFYAGII